jgi:photosystem II stability/assembly factor-like uncharacterized protein
MIDVMRARMWHARLLSLAGTVLSVLLHAAATAAQEPGTSEKPRLRWEYFYHQRAYPFDAVPAGALQRAYAQYRARWPTAVISRRPAVGLAQQAPGTSWEALGPAPIADRSAGRLSTIALHPTNPNTIYIGAAQGGVWRTTDGGQNWVALTDNECSLAMGSIALDPVNPDIIYAGTGELHFSGDSYYGCGVLRSTDGGNTWVRLGGAEFDSNAGGARISKVVVDRPTAGSVSTTTLYVASSVGVYRSTDSGATWARVLTGIATDLVVNPADPRTLYAAVGGTTFNEANGVYKTTNGGATWTKLTGGFPTNDVGRISLAIAPSLPDVLYASIQNAFENPRTATDGQLLGIWKTIDAGTTWARLTPTNISCGTQCWYDLVIAVHPTNPDFVLFGGVQLYRSQNGGNTFGNVTAGTHVDQHAIEFDPRNPSTVYIGNDGGIYRSTTNGTGWLSINGNLQVTQFYAGIGLHPSDSRTVLGGTQDNGTLEFGGAPIWQQVLGGDGGFTAIDHQNPNFAYAEPQWTPNSGFSGPWRRDAPGAFGSRKVNGIGLADRALFIPPLLIDRTDPKVLYFGTYRLYRTGDQGELWTAISPELSRTGTGVISAISPAESDPAIIYVGTNDGYVQLTIDSGANWSIRSAGLPNRAVTDIAVSAVDPTIAIATLSGFGTGHVFRTTNSGVSWQDISGDLPDVPVNAVLFDAGLGDVLYIGTDLGMFRSLDTGRTWTPFNDGFPNVAVFDLAYGRATGMIVAATHGRGMYGLTPFIAANVTLSLQTLTFSAIGDTTRILAAATDLDGDPITELLPSWRSLDARVATVNVSGVVRAAGNGTTSIVATIAGKADTAQITVRQIVVAVAGLPDTASLVVGEIRKFDAAAVDRNGIAVSDEPVTWSSTDAVAAAVDATGLVRAGRVGSSTVSAISGAVRDTVALRIGAPAIVVLDASSTALSGAPSSANGSRIPLLRLQFRVDGVEPIRVTQLGFEVRGDDPGARLQLIQDRNGDGAINPGDSDIASAPAALRPGAALRIVVPLGSLEVQVGQTISVLAALRMSGAAPNGTTFTATFAPADTRSVGVRSNAENLIHQPSAPVASAEVKSTVLAAGQRFSMSENPVRSGAVTFNFPVRPTVAGIYTLNGRLVADLTTRVNNDASVRWDLTNENGSAVSPGVYLLVFRIEGEQFRERLIVMRRAGEEEMPTPDSLTKR